MRKQFASILLILLISACSKEKSSSESNYLNNSISSINVSYINAYPHDTNSYTEGFLIHNGKLFESTGATSDLPQTKSLFGQVDLGTGKIDVKVELDRNKYFGEGIVFLGGQVFQLTYKSRVGFVYNEKNFNKIRHFKIPSKEGWGLTTDGKHLIMSDGTNTLTYLDPLTLKVFKTISIYKNSSAQEHLNELEYINGYIYANIWMKNYMVKIDPNSGKIIAIIDLSSFANEAKSIYPDSREMNGIAYDSTDQSLLITGKLWPKIYRIKIEL